MKFNLFIFFYFIYFLMIFQQAHLLSELVPGKVTLQNSNAGSPYLTRCHNCGPAKF